jgi:hypothetical protein
MKVVDEHHDKLGRLPENIKSFSGSARGKYANA